MPDNRSSFDKVFMKLEGPVGLNQETGQQQFLLITGKNKSLSFVTAF